MEQEAQEEILDQTGGKKIHRFSKSAGTKLSLAGN
jgi:hypothetical protein